MAGESNCFPESDLFAGSACLDGASVCLEGVSVCLDGVSNCLESPRLTGGFSDCLGAGAGESTCLEGCSVFFPG